MYNSLSGIGNFKDNILTEFYWYNMLLVASRDFHLPQNPTRKGLKAATLESGRSPDSCTAVLSCSWRFVCMHIFVC